MSRICVKNLPKYATDDRLREFFSQKGEVTDAKIMRTADGKSRQFGFVGFRTEKEASEALKYFNNAFMDTCKLLCEVARKVGDPNTPRPWSRHSLKKSGLNSDATNTRGADLGLCCDEGKEDNNKHLKNDKGSSKNTDPQLMEFLQIMQPRIKSKIWSNDTFSAANAEHVSRVNAEGQQVKGSKMHATLAGLEDEDRDAENKLENNAISVHASPSKKNSDKIVHNEVISDMDYFRSRVRKDWSDSDDDGDCSLERGNDSDAVKESVRDDHVTETQSQQQGAEFYTGRLFVRNLPYTAHEEDLLEYFGKFGEVSEVHLVTDKQTKRSKGFGYVYYTLPESAARALGELDNSSFQGRLLHIMPAKQQNIPEKLQSDDAVGTKAKFKQQKEEHRKASEASGNLQAWNSLFMRQDTVVENIARRYGVNKSELLNPEADDLAVRIALGETHVIAETKKALMNAGVNVAALEELASGKTESAKRSNRVILVKNLPYGSTEDELMKMFGRFGNLDKVILPPTKTLALVIFLESAEARSAFKGLAYKRYKDAPLYLEWAPDNILSSSHVADAGQDGIDGQKDKRMVLEQKFIELSEDIDPDKPESRSIFVKNLNFTTSEEPLRHHFIQNLKSGSILSVKITKHLKNGKNLSRGFGFIEFDSLDTAKTVCADLQGTILEGHALKLELCHAKQARSDGTVPAKVDKDRNSTKLIVRNVAFEATKKDLKQLFSPFGQIKQLRLPKKFDGNHRGFAFVEYVTKQEAQSAFDGLSNSHLYGRHLVIERAKDGESLEELRARTAAQFSDATDATGKSASKKRKQLSVDEANVKFQKIAT